MKLIDFLPRTFVHTESVVIVMSVTFSKFEGPQLL